MSPRPSIRASVIQYSAVVCTAENAESITQLAGAVAERSQVSQLFLRFYYPSTLDNRKMGTAPSSSSSSSSWTLARVASFAFAARRSTRHNSHSSTPSDSAAATPCRTSLRQAHGSEWGIVPVLNELLERTVSRRFEGLHHDEDDQRLQHYPPSHHRLYPKKVCTNCQLPLPRRPAITLPWDESFCSLDCRSSYEYKQRIELDVSKWSDSVKSTVASSYSVASSTSASEL